MVNGYTDRIIALMHSVSPLVSSIEYNDKNKHKFK